MSTLSRCGAPRLLNIETTAIGSVAAISAPNTIACGQPKPGPRPSALIAGSRITAVSPIAAATPGTARAAIGTRSRQKSRNSRWNAASKSSPGRNTA